MPDPSESTPSSRETSTSVVLAIEASQRAGGVALRDSAGDIHQDELPEHRRYDETLMPTIAGLFERAGLQPTDLDAVGVSLGPGGFTGLRISVTTAKVLAESLGAKVVGVPSAVVAAETYEMQGAREASCPLAMLNRTPEGTRMLVALACKDESCWMTRLVRGPQHWRIEEQPGLASAKTLILDEVAILLADAHLVEPIRSRCEQEDIERDELVLAATACLRVMLRRLARDEDDDLLNLNPIYARAPAVTLKR